MLNSLFIFILVYSISRAVMELVMYICKKMVIIVINIDDIIDRSVIANRAEMYAVNRSQYQTSREVKKKAYLEYMYSHLSEQKVIPCAALEVIKLQSKGYNLAFYSPTVSNDLQNREVMANMMNEWRISGELWLVGDVSDKTCNFSEAVIKCIRKRNRNKIVTKL